MTLALSLCLVAARAPEVLAGDRLDAYYPEGPLVAGSGVIFAEMHKDRVVTWQNGQHETLYESDGCGPTAVAHFDDGFAVLCHMTDEIHIIGQDGTLDEILDSDIDGATFDNPNDASADADGGVYFSASGLFRRSKQPSGELLYLAANRTIRRMDAKLNYSNGVHFDTRTRVLYVSEHLGARVLSYPETGPGQLGAYEVFKDFSQEKVSPIDGFHLTGPDGLETDVQGNLYVAYYGAGLLYILSPQGEPLRRITGQEPLLTNVALADEGQSLILTGSAIGPSRPYPGSVRKIDNPLHRKKGTTTTNARSKSRTIH